MGEPIQQLASTDMNWWQMLWALLVAPLFSKKFQELMAELLWHKTFGKLWKKFFPEKSKEDVKFVERREIDHVEQRLNETIQANHEKVIRELREHDQRVMDNREKDREWIQSRFDHQYEKIDNFLAMIAMNQRAK